MTDYRARNLPNNYKPYFLEDLIDEVNSPQFRQNMQSPQLSPEQNDALFAKI